ncbi:FAD/NAD(P)-binding protein, partial [Streptomyces sp. SID5606]|uniref:FAD/NAD(P)-binding protein n=1 Tax=Streptomyces sp. SID5606 TaxID=2690305 RepID=UPI00136FE901
LGEARALGPDSYPTRSFYGHYLEWVFQRVTQTAPDHVRTVVHRARAVALDDGDDGTQHVRLDDGTLLTGLDAVVLAQGHLPAQGPDHAGATQGTPGAVPPVSPYDAQGPAGPTTPGVPGQHGAPQPYRDGPGDPAATGRPSTPTGGAPIDYSHPRRQNAAPPPPPPTAPPAEPGRTARPVAGDATGWSMEERLYNQVWGMFEDLARTTAAYRSAVDFADSRMEKELDQALSDPRSRIGGQGDAAREAARARHGELVSRAREVLDRDVAQLLAEAEVVEPALPAAFARWDNPVWHAYRVPMEIPMALRLGDLHLPDADRVRIPLLMRLPLERGLWIDSGRSASAEGSL